MVRTYLGWLNKKQDNGCLLRLPNFSKGILFAFLVTTGLFSGGSHLVFIEGYEGNTIKVVALLGTTLAGQKDG